MKKIKKFWQENSVLLVLLLILIACIIAISIVVITYFVGGSNDKYGDRLEGIESHPFSSKEEKEIIAKIEEDDKISQAKIELKGKRIIINITFIDKTTLVEAESKSLATLDYFSEDTLNFYDLEYNIKASATDDTEGFTITGSHNVSGSGGIVWNNNTVFEKEEE